ncbi:hypothetical protein D3C84_1009650 [compost metagenome]
MYRTVVVTDIEEAIDLAHFAGARAEAHVLILVDEIRIGRHYVETVGRHVRNDADRVSRFTGSKCPGRTQCQKSQRSSDCEFLEHC